MKRFKLDHLSFYDVAARCGWSSSRYFGNKLAFRFKFGCQNRTANATVRYFLLHIISGRIHFFLTRSKASDVSSNDPINIYENFSGEILSNVDHVNCFSSLSYFVESYVHLPSSSTVYTGKTLFQNRILEKKVFETINEEPLIYFNIIVLQYLPQNVFFVFGFRKFSEVLIFLLERVLAKYSYVLRKSSRANGKKLL